jgi:predicted RNase H-like nuclease (RuvC/YqgF family)
MTREKLQRWQLRSVAARLLCGAFLLALSPAASAQDIRGIEACMSEKQIERRTGCLQANIEFLHQSLTRLAREVQDKIAAAGRDLAAARAEIAELRSAMAKMNGELAQLKAKAEPAGSNKKAEPPGTK